MGIIGAEEDIFNIEQECFSEPWSLGAVRYQLESENTICRVASENGAAVGYVLGAVSADEAELYRLAVLPEYRKKGFGAALLREFLGECAARGARCVFLEVWAGNLPAIALYRRAGFQKIAVRKGYYENGDALIFKILTSTGKEGNKNAEDLKNDGSYDREV